MKVAMCNKWRYRSDRSAGDTAPGSILADFLWCVSRRSLCHWFSSIWVLGTLPSPAWSWLIQADWWLCSPEILLRWNRMGTVHQLSTRRYKREITQQHWCYLWTWHCWLWQLTTYFNDLHVLYQPNDSTSFATSLTFTDPFCKLGILLAGLL